MYLAILKHTWGLRHHLTCTGLLLLLTSSLLTPALAKQSDNNIHLLEMNKPLERELPGGQSQSYRITLTAGQYIRVVVDQRGIDVVVSLFGPDGKQIVEVDSPNGTQGPEPVLAIAETSGAYRLEVRSLEKNASVGRYEVKIEEVRKATEQDKSRIAAERAYMQAELLRAEGTAESLQSAIRKYEEALPLYHTIGDRSSEALVLNQIGLIDDQLGEKRKALDCYGQSLTLYRAVGDRDGEATTLNNIGLVYYSLDERQKALDYFAQALPIFITVGDRSGEATTLGNIGAAYNSLGNRQKALEYHGQALSLKRAAGDQDGEAETLNNIGSVYGSLGERQRAFEYHEQALTLYRALNDRRGQAVTLFNIGWIYNVSGEKQKALDYDEQALVLFRAVGDRGGEAKTLNEAGMIYHLLGERQKALDYYMRALPLLHTVEERTGEATVLNNIGGIYDDLGEKQEAIDYYTKALTLHHELGDHNGEAVALNNIGGGYDDLGEERKALEHYTRALPLYGAGEQSDRAMTLNNIGLIYFNLGETRKALDYYGQALPLYRAVGDRGREARALLNIGRAYFSLGETQKALDHYEQSLRLSYAAGDRDGKARVFNNLMKIYESLNKPRLAVFYGKQSVNAYQQLRSNVQGLDKNVQKTYLRSVERTYRSLAELLITQGRLTEAQQVLNAFKDQQFFDFDRTQARSLQPLTRTPREAEYATLYEKASDDLDAIGGEVAELKRKVARRQPTEEEAAQLRQLEARLITALSEFSGLFRQAETGFSRSVGETDKVGEVSDTAQLRVTLRQLKKDTGRSAVAIYTLAGEARFYALIVTTDSITSVSSAISADELNKKARELWALLQSDAYDSTKVSNELYTVVFKPIGEKLPTDTETIMWSLDGNLRYVPMAALYDGRHYLIERYSHVNFTRADAGRMTRPVTKSWTATGMGASVAHTVDLLGTKFTFGELPGVGEELRMLVRQKDSPQGLFEGEVLQDENFTRAAMLSVLSRKRPVVHIASHFAFRPGDEERSFLLMGDGTALTLAEMKRQEGLFDGVELLTLSACNTAAQLAGANGREVDAFAELAQRLGANAVMATLWPVADSSTPWLMQDFYQARRDQTLNKAEALRRAQLALLDGRAKVTPSPVMQRTAPKVQVLSDNATKQTGNTRAELVFIDVKNAVPYKKDPHKPFAHPYYWSPFILIGNWR
jgi:CHAT domain-containing protein/tetratricopeptide (TPR) repeat protein